MSFVITIGREYGSGGRYIAKELAKRLNVKYYDNDLLLEVAKANGFGENYVKENDEKKEVFWSGFLSNGMLDPINSIYSPTQSVALATFDVIKKLADTESCVIVGRCSSAILKDRENVLNVFITAPMKDKVERAVKYYGVDPNKAESIINKENKNRAKYFDFYTEDEWGKASSYDLCLSSHIGIEETVDVIIEYMNRLHMLG